MVQLTTEQRIYFAWKQSEYFRILSGCVFFYTPCIVKFSFHLHYTTTVCIKKRLAFEIQISHNVLNLPDKYNCLKSFSES